MKFVVCGNYGAKNLGDEMILEGLLTMIQSLDPKAEVTILSGNPAETQENYQTNKSRLKIFSLPKFPSGARSILKSLISRLSKSSSNNPTAEAVKNCNYFILGGGGLFGSLTLRSNIIWAVQALMAYKYHKPVIMYGQSISPIRWKFVRIILKKIFQKANYIAVRDDASVKELKKIGVSREINVIPDLAFRKPLSENSPEFSENRKATIIVALRQMSNLSGNFCKSIANFLDWLINKHNYQIKFVNFQEGTEGDEKLHQEIASIMTNKTKIQHLKNIQSTEKLLEYFIDSDFVLGMRLHSIISAIKTAKPFIALNYSPKIKNFLESANLTDKILDLDELNFESLKKAYKLIIVNKSSLQRNLKRLSEKYSNDLSEAEKKFLG